MSCPLLLYLLEWILYLFSYIFCWNLTYFCLIASHWSWEHGNSFHSNVLHNQCLAMLAVSMRSSLDHCKPVATSHKVISLNVSCYWARTLVFFWSKLQHKFSCPGSPSQSCMNDRWWYPLMSRTPPRMHIRFKMAHCASRNVSSNPFQDNPLVPEENLSGILISSFSSSSDLSSSCGS